MKVSFMRRVRWIRFQTRVVGLVAFIGPRAWLWSVRQRGRLTDELCALVTQEHARQKAGRA